jgi:hypothetical protein
MSPTGNDSNSGMSALLPWASPDHTVNCGDVISAAPGTYAPLTQFGTVNCPEAAGVAWLSCAKFDACKIRVTSGGQYAAAVQIGTSNWGVQGWEASTVSTAGACFFAYPATPTTIHHIIFANDIANGCGQGGFEASPNGSAGVDYFVVAGSIAYNAVQGSNNCTSGINIFKPVAFDNLPGTHIYLAGNFAYSNVEPRVCAGVSPTDGQGLFFDTSEPYSEQMVIENNMALFNGGSGIKSYANSNGAPNAKIFIRNNTTYGNETGSVNGGVCAEITLQESLSSEVFGNLSQAGAAVGCYGSKPLYVYGADSPDSTDEIYANYGYSAVGNDAAGQGSGFSFATSNIFADPQFAEPTKPAAPRCGDSPSVRKCMSTVIANFTPTAQAALQYGYHVPSGGQGYNPLFPLWLCNVNLPFGLVTMGCLSAPPSS